MDIDQIRRAVATAASMAELDQISAHIITLNAAGLVGDAEAQAFLDVIVTKRRIEGPLVKLADRLAASAAKRAKAGDAPASSRGAGSALRKLKRKRQFGHVGAIPLDRNAKTRIMIRARTLMRRSSAGRAYGEITAKAYAVLGALLYGFHNGETGFCFPSYEAIAEKAGCARSTVHLAIQALEAAGLIGWSNRMARVRERCRDLLGGNGTRIRVVRTSNTYRLLDPLPTKSERPTGTRNQVHSLRMFQQTGRLTAYREKKEQGHTLFENGPTAPQGAS